MDHYTGTKPVAASHLFDTAALEHYLADRLPGFAGPLSVEQFKGGQSNPTYKLITPACSYVMRSKPGPASKVATCPEQTVWSGPKLTLSAILLWLTTTESRERH